MGLKSSAFPILRYSSGSTVAVDTNILSSDLTVTSESLGGGSGLWRVWYVINSADSGADFIFKVIRTNADDTVSTAREELTNSDLDFVSKSRGSYRFDIDVFAGDSINFQVETTSILTIPKLRIQQIQIGA